MSRRRPPLGFVEPASNVLRLEVRPHPRRDEPLAGRSGSQSKRSATAHFFCRAVRIARFSTDDSLLPSSVRLSRCRRVARAASSYNQPAVVSASPWNSAARGSHARALVGLNWRCAFRSLANAAPASGWAQWSGWTRWLSARNADLAIPGVAVSAMPSTFDADRARRIRATKLVIKCGRLVGRLVPCTSRPMRTPTRSRAARAAFSSATHAAEPTRDHALRPPRVADCRRPSSGIYDDVCCGVPRGVVAPATAPSPFLLHKHCLLGCTVEVPLPWTRMGTTAANRHLCCPVHPRPRALRPARALVCARPRVCARPHYQARARRQS